MFGINGAEVLVLLLIIVIVVGPQRLPHYAEQLAEWARTAHRFVRDTRTRVGEEFSESGADVDWESLDPRRYDPRRIVREALADDDTAGRSTPPGGSGPAAVAAAHAAAVAAAHGRYAAPREETEGAGGDGAVDTVEEADGLPGPSDTRAARPLPPFDPDLT